MISIPTVSFFSDSIKKTANITIFKIVFSAFSLSDISDLHINAVINKKAIKNKNKVYIVYKSINSGITNRIIHPAELFCYIDKWYVAAFCELRNEIRLFKLENILEYNGLEDKYENKK